MKFQYKQLFYSSCLTLASLCILSAQSQAGFEWTPPPEPPKLPKKMPPVPAENVEEHALDQQQPAEQNLPPVIHRNNEQEKPTLKVKVLSPEPKQEPMEKPTPVIEEAKKENMPVTLDKAPEIRESKPESAPKMTKTESMQPVQKQAKAAVPQKAQTGAVEVDLFPLGNKTNEAEQTETTSLTPVLLPSDPNTKLDDISADEMAEAHQEMKMAKASPAQEEIKWNKAETFEVLEGFGSDMPLVMALRQIVPPYYAFSFGDGVNPGQKVSWEGGKPWNEVLEATLEPLEIGFTVKDHKLILTKIMPEVMPIAKEPEEKPMDSKPEKMGALENSIDDAEKKKPEALITEADKPIIEGKIVTLPVDNPEAAKKTLAEKPEKVSRKAILDPGKTESHQNEAAASLVKMPENPVLEERKEIENAKSISDKTHTPIEVAKMEKPSFGTPETKRTRKIEEKILDHASKDLPEAEPESEVETTTLGANEVQENPSAMELITWNEAPPPVQTEPDIIEDVLKAEAPKEKIIKKSAEKTLEPFKNETEEIIEQEAEDIAEIASIAPPKPIEPEPAPVTLTPAPKSKKSPIMPMNIEPSTAPKVTMKTVQSKIHVWKGDSGDDIHDVLGDWSKDLGVELSWNTKDDPELKQNVLINGTLENALKILFDQSTAKSLKYSLQENPQGVKLIIDPRS